MVADEGRIHLFSNGWFIYLQCKDGIQDMVLVSREKQNLMVNLKVQSIVFVLKMYSHSVWTMKRLSKKCNFAEHKYQVSLVVRL